MYCSLFTFNSTDSGTSGTRTSIIRAMKNTTCCRGDGWGSQNNEQYVCSVTKRSRGYGIIHRPFCASKCDADSRAAYPTVKYCRPNQCTEDTFATYKSNGRFLVPLSCTLVHSSNINQLSHSTSQYLHCHSLTGHIIHLVLFLI